MTSHTSYWILSKVRPDKIIAEGKMGKWKGGKTCSKKKKGMESDCHRHVDKQNNFQSGTRVKEFNKR